ncbi:hypothetical protein BU23DRAFT_556464 [Bimuria novae-zelandiae CBS 107.79]|uniref:DUF1772-domain-containing protein n=1 Tax=Bimuria novae-zelandiae CBS 107.79 TaxID=1447943 RepID=A0A6A5V0Y5_9PLEO|nr:hypothetical protein BU23DRAFT_556464 [Bimuria novae-zelandiae CBS 107.79]
MSATQLVQIVSIATALVAAGGIATLSLFDVPLLLSQPASRSLPLTRWLFSRGSHIFPSAAFVSSGGFAFLAYDALPPATVLRSATQGGPVGYYIAAALLSISIAPWTSLVMIPTNFTLIEKNEQKGGKMSEAAPDEATRRSAEGSVNNEGGASQWTDLSGSQERTKDKSTQGDDK